MTGKFMVGTWYNSNKILPENGIAVQVSWPGAHRVYLGMYKNDTWYVVTEDGYVPDNPKEPICECWTPLADPPPLWPEG